MKKFSYTRLFVWVMSFQIISSLIGFFTKPEVTSWYKTLTKSFLTPPGYVFSIVWPLLYVCLATYGWMLWEINGKQKMKQVYIVQMLCNWSWSFLFFYMHQIFLSWVMILIMIGLTLYLVVMTCQIERKYREITFLLIPYLLWICFAFYLNGYVWIYS